MSVGLWRWVAMEDALLMLPHTLDCSTDTTGAGGPARLLHWGWLYCVRAAEGAGSS